MTTKEQKAQLEKAWYEKREALEEAARKAVAQYLVSGKQSSSFAGLGLESAAREFTETENKLREFLAKG